MKNLCSGIQCGGFQFLLILDLRGISFHAMVVFGLSKNLLFKSVLGHFDKLEIQSQLKPLGRVLKYYLCSCLDIKRPFILEMKMVGLNWKLMKYVPFVMPSLWMEKN